MIRTVALMATSCFVTALAAPSQEAHSVPPGAGAFLQQETAPDNTQRARVAHSSLTNQDVLDMLKAGLTSEIVIAKIKASTCSFDTSAVTLEALKEAGVPDGIVVAMVQAPTASSTAPDSHWRLAKTLRKDGDLDGAIAEYRELIHLQSDNPDAHYELGATIYEKGEQVAVKVARVESWPVAEAELRTALRLKPDHAGARLVLGKVLYREGLDEKADLLVATMSACDPKGNTGEYLACTRMAVQTAENLPFPKLGQAIAEFRRAVDLNPYWGETHYGLAQALWRNSYSQRSEALEEYGAACSLEPTSPKFCKEYKDHEAQWDPKWRR